MTNAQLYAEIRSRLTAIRREASLLREQLARVALDPDSPDFDADEEDLETLRDSAQDIHDEADVGGSLLRELRSRIFQVQAEPTEPTSPQPETTS